jgi:hypothetical protein
MSEAAKPDGEAEALFETVRRRYGDRLTPAQLEELRKIVATQVEAARALRAVPLTNADEPMQPFVPYRVEEPLAPLSPQRGEGGQR